MRPLSASMLAAAFLIASSVAVTLADEMATRRSTRRYHSITQPIEVAKLVAPDARSGDEFGRSLAIYGPTIVVGAPGDVANKRLPSPGSAYVFEGGGRNWQIQQTLVASDYQDGASFGRSVAVWGDTIAVGAEHENHSGMDNAGAVYVFVRRGSEWVLEQKLCARDPGYEDHFGHSLSIHEDTLAIGTWGCDKAYVFERLEGTWSLVRRLHKPPPHGGNFGVSVALSESTLVVGSEWSKLSGRYRSGAAFVFERAYDSWQQVQGLTASDPEPNDGFGRSVAVSEDTIVVGAIRDDHGSSVDSGSVYVFEPSEIGWVESQKLIPGAPASGQQFGNSVCICRNYMMVGAPNDIPLGLDNAGCGYFCSRSAGSWFMVDSFWADDAKAGNLFGEVAVHGRTAVVGARLADHSGLRDAGAAYVYLLPPHVN